MGLAEMNRAVRLATALGLTGASVIVLASMGTATTCGTPDPEWVYFSFLLFFAVGVIWTVSEFVRPTILSLPAGLGLYFVVGPVGLAISREFFPRAGDFHEESTWMPFWIHSLLLAIGLVPGSC